MSTLLTGTRRYRFRQLEFWAERGLIHVLDYRPHSLEADYVSMTVEDALEKAHAFNDSLKRFKHADERQEHARLVEQLISCIAQARFQGDPTDKRVTDYKKNHRGKPVILVGR